MDFFFKAESGFGEKKLKLLFVGWLIGLSGFLSLLQRGSPEHPQPVCRPFGTRSRSRFFGAGWKKPVLLGSVSSEETCFLASHLFYLTFYGRMKYFSRENSAFLSPKKEMSALVK